MKPILWAFLITVFGWSPVWGQIVPNPFDLSPRLAPSAAGERAQPGAWDTGNPFDVAHAVAPVSLPPSTKAKTKPLKPERPRLSQEEQYKTFLFALTVGTLALLTILVTIFRAMYQRAWRGFLNENMLNQIYRESQSAGALPYYILYSYFLLSAGTFVFLVARHFGTGFPAGLWQSWLMSIGGVSALILAKHSVLAYLGAVFPIEKETGAYSFTIMIFGILLSLALVASNVLMAYGPTEYARGIVFTAFGIIGLVYTFRSLRGLLIANNFLVSHKFHFFLYLCTVEIAPVLILVKLVQNQA